VPDSTPGLERVRISSGSPYEPVVGYCRAVRVDDRVFVAGTAATMPDGGDPPSDAYGQATRCLEIIAAALAEAGGSLADVVRTRVYLTDPAHFDGFAKAHGEAFATIRPANTTVVARLLDPRWHVEIEAEAVLRSPE
jgi:enamine deaminase RidA (YjgF/YER057c/UK114 family)